MVAMDHHELDLDDVPFDPLADTHRQAQGCAIRRQRQVAWIWIFHGALLVGSATLMGLARVAFVFFRQWIYRSLEGPQYDSLEEELVRLDRLMDLALWTVPCFIAVGVVVLIAALGFLRRRPWAWRWLYVLSWLHLIGLIPVAVVSSILIARIGLTDSLPSGLQQFSYLMDGVLLAATQILLIWVHYHLSSPVVRELFIEEPPTTGPGTERHT